MKSKSFIPSGLNEERQGSAMETEKKKVSFPHAIDDFRK